MKCQKKRFWSDSCSQENDEKIEAGESGEKKYVVAYLPYKLGMILLALAGLTPISFFPYVSAMLTGQSILKEIECRYEVIFIKFRNGLVWGWAFSEWMYIHIFVVKYVQILNNE